MNLKRTFGTILTLLGICGLIYTAWLVMNTSNSNYSIKAAATFGILGLVFFGSGIGLVRTTKDQEKSL